MPLLSIQGLSVRFATPAGEVPAVDGLDLDVEERECVAIVGESGSGKSQALLAATGLLAANGSATGRVRFDDEDILGDATKLARLRGAGIGFVFQDAAGSLTPHLTIGSQMAETLQAHRNADRASALAEARRMLDLVQVPDAPARLAQYPHELSGGTRQRVAIAAALVARPRLLIADEPTTALDVTVQAQVVQLFRTLQAELGMALVLVTHDLGVVAGLAARVVVMYAGRKVEEGDIASLFRAPRHPYTGGLLAAVPRLDDDPARPMRTVPGVPPRPGRRPAGCAFSPRCAQASDRCRQMAPGWTPGRHGVACHHPLGPAP